MLNLTIGHILQILQTDKEFQTAAAGLPIRLVRHSLNIQKTQPLEVINRVKDQKDIFEEWQRIQWVGSQFEPLRKSGVFLSFLSEGNSARFFGVFQNSIGNDEELKGWEDYLGHQPTLAPLWKKHGKDQGEWKPCFCLKTTRMPHLADLTGRLTVEWQNPGLVPECRPDSPLKVQGISLEGDSSTRIAKPWLGMNEVSLSFDELEEMMKWPDTWAVWHTKLSSKGVYLITHEGDGKMYVGSATGENGIIGRWRDYANHPHDGGNDGLKELLRQNPEAYKRFRFSILEVMEGDVMEWEERWKEKLRSRDFGLNSKHG